MRPHTIKNQKQHQATLNALTGQQLDYYLQWFKELPTHLDLPGLRIVHACWDDYQLSIIKQELSRYKGFNTALLTAAVDPASNLYTAIETVLKGPEIPLPAGCSYLDKEGNRRTRIRTKWYEPLDKQLISQYMMPPGSYPDLSLDIPLPATDLPHVSGYPTTAVPVFIGHYWMTGSNPTPLADNVACVDYSVAQDGLLAAYRWDNETMLQENKFISVPPDAR